LSNTPDQNNKEQELVALGSYDLEARLGQGGMGIVYLATDKKLSRQVAIKVLHPHLLRHENLKERFRREARMHAKLMHPNIVTLLSLYEDEEHMALVMEMVHGKDLKAYLRANPQLPLQEKLDIAVHILTGLEAAHKFGMVHRDLKPANVLISKQHEVKLMDFGLAKPEQGDDDLTQSGATVGSFRYMSPEQILNQPIDARTDLYAFGILMFQMTTGQLPFDATSNGGEFEIMEKQVRELPENPHKLNPSIPNDLSNLILSLLEKNKQDRPKNADAVRQQIREIKDRLNENQKTSTAQPNKKQSRAAAAPSNGEVAQQWINIAVWRVQDILGKVSPALNKPSVSLAAIALAFIMLGTAVITVLNLTNFSSEQAVVATQQSTDAKAKVEKPKPATAAKAVEPTAKVVKKPVETTKVVKAAAVVSIKEPEKVIAAKKLPAKSKIKQHVKNKKQPPRLITYSARHSVTRSDGSKVNSRRKHEFRGGKHRFYPELKEKSWFTSFRKGESMVEFAKPVRLSTIIIHKASVGRLNFKKGYVYLEIQGTDGEWKRLFERNDDDVDRKVTIRKVYKHLKKIKAVRIKFKTAEPITIGPIDLLP